MAKPTSRVSRVLMVGPLAPFAEAYTTELGKRGYTPLTRVNLVRQMARLSRWLEGRGLGVGDVHSALIEEFITAERARCDGVRAHYSRPGLRCLLETLSEFGVVGEEPPPAPLSPTQLLLASFERHLLTERALASGTVRGYVDHARRFLAEVGCGADLADLRAKDVTAAVLRRSALVSVATTQYFVAGLRAFLRFCFVEGLVEAELSEAALALTGRRRSPLPQGITRADAAALLASCDRRSSLGRRDNAILVSALRLGLRAAEVAYLRLDDFDWRAGEVVVRGKGGRQDRLPLPTEVGEAVAAYLERGRPSSTERQVFLQARAPFRPIDPATVRSTVRRACRRAGVAEIGSHRLRHTLACEMVAADVPLTQVAQVLRHHSLQTTAVYARVDVGQLRALARPWPGGLR